MEEEEEKDFQQGDVIPALIPKVNINNEVIRSYYNTFRLIWKRTEERTSNHCYENRETGKLKMYINFLSFWFF